MNDEGNDYKCCPDCDEVSDYTILSFDFRGDGNCKYCNGEGKIDDSLRAQLTDLLGKIITLGFDNSETPTTIDCPKCNGTGQCQTCGGNGRVKVDEYNDENDDSDESFEHEHDDQKEEDADDCANEVTSEYDDTNNDHEYVNIDYEYDDDEAYNNYADLNNGIAGNKEKELPLANHMILTYGRYFHYLDEKMYSLFYEQIATGIHINPFSGREEFISDYRELIKSFIRLKIANLKYEKAVNQLELLKTGADLQDKVDSITSELNVAQTDLDSLC